MPRRLRTAAMSLAEVLTDCTKYTIPDYQRVYAWDENQITPLLSDLIAAMRGKPGQPWLYFGTIYLARPPDRQEAQIADGHQRMLTATMLYAAGRDLAENPAEADRLHTMLLSPAPGGGAPDFRFAPRDHDAAFFRQWVQERGATLRPLAVDEQDDAGEDEVQGPQSATSAGSESRCNIIANRNAIVASLRELGPSGRRQLFEFLEASAEIVVITAPTLEEARNAYASTQSRGLRQAETDKLKAELICDCPAPQRRLLAGHWDECEAILGKEDLAELLQHMIVVKSERKPQHALQDDLFAAFGLPANVQSFIEGELVPSARAYRRICTAAATGSRQERRIGGHLITLRRTTHDAWKAPALLALREIASNEALGQFLGELERLAAVMMIVGTDPNEMMERYVAAIRAIKGKSPGAGAALQLTAAELKEARERLTETRFGRRERYRTPLLLKLNDLIGNGVEAIDPKTISCEHILPRNAPKGPWRHDFRKRDSTRYDGGSYVDLVGNLAILTHQDNRLVGADPFATKRPILKRSAFALANEAAKAKAWTPEVVRERTELLAAMLAKYWRLQGT
jgi:hypothetical protein